MGHNGSPYNYVIHAALIARSRVANYQLPTSSGLIVAEMQWVTVQYNCTDHEPKAHTVFARSDAALD